MRKRYLAGCLFLIASGCSKGPPGEPAATPAPIHIASLEPNNTSVATAFKALPDGKSQLVVFGTMPYGATVLWNDQPVESRGGGQAGFVLGVIPVNLVQMGGTAKITVRDGSTLSNALDFTIYEKTGPAPQITAVDPAGAIAGRGFNLQPGGGSALGVTGVGFLPGVRLMVDGKTLDTTVFGHDNFISATLPGALVAKAGSHQVWVANPDKKTSNKIEFKVTAN